MDLTPDGVVRSGNRFAAAAQNYLEVARFGGLETGEEPAPYEVVHEQPMYRLLRYLPGTFEADARGVSTAPPAILVPPLMLAAGVYDVSPASSAVRQLAEHGVDPWVVDFGNPSQREGGADRTLTDHVIAVSDAIDRVAKETGRPVHLCGYSQGGMFCYQAAAYRRGEGLASLVTFGSPVDTREALPIPVPEELLVRTVSYLADTVLPKITIPAWVSRNGFRMLDPAKTARSRFDFFRQLHDRDALLPRESQRRFLENEGWVAWSGPAVAELAKQFVAQNRMLAGGFVIEDRISTLADITCPTLCFVGEVDTIAPPRAVRAIRRAVPLADIYESTLKAGHFGLVVGSTASRTTWPTVAGWIHWREDDGGLPEAVHPLTEDEDEKNDVATAVERAGELVGLSTDVGVGLLRGAAGAAGRGMVNLRQIAGDALDQMPRLNRLQDARASTRISMGLLLDEQASRTPDAIFFLYEGRGHTWGDAKRRIDNIVRGLISVGVRQGEHVGVLMGTRPSAIAVVSALSRLGAVVVLLRPDGNTAREAELGQVTRVIADPEDAEQARQAGVPVLVLGGGGEPRELGFGLTDMERIDPDAVQVPAWYTPNPGRGRDLAFILFTGHGDTTRANRITNRRWSLSAFGTASSATLRSSDTVYAVTPLHHPSGLLTSIGGAIAGGARLALTRSFDSSTFWDEVRRYGVTIVPYTWTSARELVNAPPHPAEPGHPVRLFIGSGMPPALWKRVTQRFAPARVLEFYASTEGEAVLANLSSAKPGAKGRPLPGSATVRIAEYDLKAGRLAEGPDGFALPCRRGEVGMLLASAQHNRSGLLGSPLRGVFQRDDAWQATGDLFRKDDDGDYWLVDHVSSLIHTASGPVVASPSEDALGALSAVDLAVAYGIPSKKGHEVLTAALVLLPGKELDAARLTAAVAKLADEERPQVVRIVDHVPLTTWYRAVKAPLKAEGAPDGAWVWDPKAKAYKALDAASRRRLGI